MIFLKVFNFIPLIGFVKHVGYIFLCFNVF